MFIGDYHFGVDIVHGLEDHSESAKVTYAYHFTELVQANPDYDLSPSPQYLKYSANHMDELYYVFGTAYMLEYLPNIWKGIDHFLLKFQEIVYYPYIILTVLCM